jgi:cation diffusion facilitator CzcD-associated flavoprotein CzcO
VLVVGCGQSGAQIAEDLHLAGRKVHLATGNAPRCARFYRGREVVDWLADMKYYDMPVTEHPLREGVRDNTNHYVTGRDGGRDIDLRRFAREGMALYGLLSGFDGGSFELQPNLRENLDSADDTYNRINASIDKHIAAQGHRGAAALGLHARVGAGRRTHPARPRGGGHHQRGVVHRLLARTSPGWMRRSSTAAARRCTCAA